METKDLEDFYRRWLSTNNYVDPQSETITDETNNQNVQNIPSAAMPIQNENQIDNIVFENDIFQLYIEKGN